MSGSGFVEDFADVISIMKELKLFIHPATREGGSSLVTLEANAYGLPSRLGRCTAGEQSKTDTAGIDRLLR
jgi:hypothetical protein